MQQLNISKISSYQKNQDIIFLVEQDTQFAGLDLSADEQAYVKKEFDKKAYQVFINRFTHWVLVQTFDSTKKKDQIKENLRKAGHTACMFLQKHKVNTIKVADHIENPIYCLALAEGIALSNYQFIKYQKTADEKATSLKSIEIISPNLTEGDIKNLAITVESVFWARDMVNEPVSVLNSVTFANEIEKFVKSAGAKVEVYGKEKIAQLKMGGLLAVNQGSAFPPTFSILEWKPENARNSAPIVLVGKGVVYDTGGLSLKPTADSMDYMKCDMAGGAAVAATMAAIARIGLPLYVVALVPATDNFPGPNSYVPGDVITIMDGTTVEVLNTDAEGRLILADALCFAKNYKPELVIDVATLTGAAHRAIGSQGVVGMGNASDETIARITQSGHSVHERVAVFPFWDEYNDSIKSEIADLKNIGGELAGAITAGKFLEYFTDYPYFHLDIAGTAFLKKADSYKGTGASGFGVRLLVDFLTNYFEK